MPVSLVIALVGAAFVALLCGYLFLFTILRGKLGIGSGRIDWNTCPTGMTVALLSFLVLPVAIVCVLATRWNGGVAVATHIVALVVAGVLFLLCGYLFLHIAVRGRFEASGYVIDWKASPIGMTVALTSCLVCPAIIAWGIVGHWNEIVAPWGQYRVYIDYLPGFRPDLRYEGPGVTRELFITKDSAGNFLFSFSAMCLPPGTAWELDGINDLPQYRLFDFSGTLSYSNGTCQLTGGLDSQERGQLVIAQSGDEISLHPGKNRIAVTWTVSFR